MSEHRPPAVSTQAHAALPEAEPQLRGSWGLITAISFLTSVPIGAPEEMRPELLRRALRYFPIVGALVGLLTAAVLAGAAVLWPIWLAVIIALIAEAFLTGALHEDGLADCCDAFGGGWSREDVLRIMKDSRVGTYGIVGVLFALGLKASSLYMIVAVAGVASWWVWGSVVLAAAAAGRWSMVLTMVSIRPVENRKSLTSGFGGAVPRIELFLSTLAMLLAVLPYAIFMFVPFLASALLCGSGVVLLHMLFQRRLGGITGDCLGCVAYISQVLVLLGGAIRVQDWS